MKALLSIGVIGAGGDTTMFVSPPEAVAEQFARKLAGARYDVARAHLADDSPAMRERIRTTSIALRRRAGAISNVDGRPGAIDGDVATATAVITTARAGEIDIAFTLIRRSGAWRIAEWSARL
jgi:hypothetical protein